MEHLGYLFAAYAIIFIVILAYVIFLWRRQTQLQDELKAIEGRIGAGAPTKQSSRSAT